MATPSKTETVARGKVVRSLSVAARGVSLSGIPVEYDLHTAESDTVVRKIRMIYIEPASVANDEIGVTLMLGTNSDPTRFAVWNSDVSSSAWSVVNVPISCTSNILYADETLVLRVGKGKTGAGMVSIQIEIHEL